MRWRPEIRDPRRCTTPNLFAKSGKRREGDRERGHCTAELTNDHQSADNSPLVSGGRYVGNVVKGCKKGSTFRSVT